MKNQFINTISVALVLVGCHPGYKSLSKINKSFDVQMEYYELDKDIQDVYQRYYASKDFVFDLKDTASLLPKVNTVKRIVSLDSNYPVEMISGYSPWSGDSFKLFKASGLYFSIAGWKYFNNTEFIEPPIIYKDGYFYYPNGAFVNPKEGERNRNDYNNRYYTKKKARKPR